MPPSPSRSIWRGSCNWTSSQPCRGDRLSNQATAPGSVALYLQPGAIKSQRVQRARWPGGDQQKKASEVPCLLGEGFCSVLSVLICLMGPRPGQGLLAKSIWWDSWEEAESRVSSTLSRRLAFLHFTSSSSAPLLQTAPSYSPFLYPALYATLSYSLGSSHVISYISSLGCLSSSVWHWSFTGFCLLLAQPLPDLPAAVGSLFSRPRSLAPSAIAQP